MRVPMWGGLFLLKGFAVYWEKNPTTFPSLFPPPTSVCIKISVKIKVCFCILQIVIQTVSRKELVIHYYIQHIYTHAGAPPKTIKLAGKKKTYFLFLLKPKQTCTGTFSSLFRIAPHFCKEIAAGMNLVLSLSNSVPIRAEFAICPSQGLPLRSDLLRWGFSYPTPSTFTPVLVLLISFSEGFIYSPAI